MPRQTLEEAQVFALDEGLGARLKISVFDSEKKDEEDFVQLFDTDRDAIISIDVSVWRRIVRQVELRLADKEG